MAADAAPGVTPPADGAAGTVRALIDAQAAARPDAVYAIGTRDGLALTHGELAARCREFGALLRGLGSAPGDHVSVVMPNGVGTLVVLLGALYGGWCVNPVNLLSQPDQMRYVLDHADARVVAVSPDWAERVRTMVADSDREVTVLVLDPDSLDWLDAGVACRGAGRSVDLPAPSAEVLALLMYTSGTTGRPKGVMLSQSNLAANARAISAEHALAPSDRVLAVLPLYHINAFAVTMLAPLAHGGSLVMPPRFSASAYSSRSWRPA